MPGLFSIEDELKKRNKIVDDAKKIKDKSSSQTTKNSSAQNTRVGNNPSATEFFGLEKKPVNKTAQVNKNTTIRFTPIEEMKKARAEAMAGRGNNNDAVSRFGKIQRFEDIEKRYEHGREILRAEQQKKQQKEEDYIKNIQQTRQKDLDDSANRYGINRNSFYLADFENWKKEYEITQTRLGMWRSGKNNHQAAADAQNLFAIATENEKKKTALEVDELTQQYLNGDTLEELIKKQNEERVTAFFSGEDQNGEHSKNAAAIKNARAMLTKRQDQEKFEGYLKLFEAPDFAEKSKPKSDGYIEGYVPPIFLSPEEKEKRKNNGLAQLSGEDYKYLFTTEAETALYAYICNTQGKNAGKEFLSFLEPTLNARVAEKEKGDAVKLATESPRYANLKAITNMPERAVMGAIGSIDGFIDEQTTGERRSIDINSPWFKNTRETENIRETISKDMSPAGRWLYNVGSSLGDMAMILPLAAIPGVGQALSLGMMGAEAGQQTVYDATQRGAYADEAFTLGVISAGIEVLTEKIPLDNLFDMVKMPAGSRKKLITQVLKQGGIESGEEVISEVLNYAFDLGIMGDKSQHAIAKQQYIAQGKTPQETERLAVKDFIKNVGMAGLGGFISGIAFGGAGTTINKSKTIFTGTRIINYGNLNEVVNRGLDCNTESDAYKTASVIANEITEGKTPTAYKVGRLAYEIQAEKMKTEIGNLVRLGKNSKSPKTVELAYKVEGQAEPNTKDVGKLVKAVITDSSSLEEHTPEQLKIMQEYENSVKSDVLEFVKYAKEAKNDNRTSIAISEVTDRQAEQIKTLTGVDVTGYEHVLKANTVRHIESRHGENGVSDSLMTDEDIARMEYVIENYDTVEVLDDVSKEYRDKQQKPAPIIRYSKRIDGTYYVVEAVPDTKKHQLPVVAAYKNKAEIQQTRDVQAPTRNVRNASADSALSNNIVPQGQNAVNDNYMRNGKENAGIVKSQAAAEFMRARPRLYTVVNELCKKFGIKAVIDSDIPGEDGYYDSKTGELHISLNAKDPLNIVFKHELTHIIEGSTEYQELVAYMKETFPHEWEMKYKGIVDKYARANKKRAQQGLELYDVSQKRMESETMAEFSEMMKTDEYIEKVALEKPGLINKFLKLIREIRQKLASVFNKNQKTSWEIAEDKWKKTLDVAVRDGVARDTGIDKHKISGYDSSKDDIDVKKVFGLINSIKRRRGVLYNNGATIKIPNNDMETLRHKYVTEKHFANRTNSLIDCISCFGSRGQKHYFYVFYKGDNGRVAPILRVDYEYMDAYMQTIEDINKEMGYKYGEINRKAKEIRDRFAGKWSEKGNNSSDADVNSDGERAEKTIGLHSKIRGEADSGRGGDSRRYERSGSSISNGFDERGRVISSDDSDSADITRQPKLSGYDEHIDIVDIPYNERRQLESYVLSKNGGNERLKTVDCKEIGNNFYVWKNNSKTDYEVIKSVAIEGNEDLITYARGEVRNGSYRNSKDIYRLLEGIVRRYRSSNRSDVITENRRHVGRNGEFSVGEQTGHGRGDFGESNRDTRENKVKYSIDSDSDTTNGNRQPKLQKPAESTLSEYIADIESENAALKEINTTLREHIGTIKDIKTDPVRVNSVVSKVIKDYKSSSDVVETASRVQNLISKFMNLGEDFTETQYNEIFKRLADIGTEIVENHKIQDRTLFDEYASLRKMLKETAVFISDGDKSSIPDFAAFRRKNFGKLKITNNSTRSVDSFYQELCLEYPEFFDTSITHPADQLMRMAKVRELIGLKNMDINAEDAGNAIAAEFIMSLTDIDDAYIDQATVERAKAEYKKKADALRKEYNDRIEKYREERKDRADRERLLKLVREVKNMRSTPENMAKIPEIVQEIDTMGISIIEKGYTRNDGTRVMDKIDLSKLMQEYNKAKAEDPNFEPNKYIEEKIGRLLNKQIGDMDIDDVRDLIEVLQAVKHEIQTAKKLINDTARREAYSAGEDVIAEINAAKGVKLKSKIGGEPLSYLGAKYNSMNLTARRMARRLVGYMKNSVFVELIDKLSEGENKMNTFMQKSTEKFMEFAEDHKSLEQVSGKKARVIEITIKGDKIQLTPDMAIALYLHSKNAANMQHIRRGGIVIPDIDLYQNGNMSQAYSAGKRIMLEPTDIKVIYDKLTTFERRLADVASDWLNNDCKKAINETSLKLLGYEVARVNNYMPIVTDSNFTKSDPLIVDGTLEGMGMLKERQNAPNPILLVGIISTIERQKNSVGKYYGLAIPIKNFNKVWNVTQVGYGTSVKDALEKKWGKQANKYIENLLKDLQQQRKTEGTFLDNLRGAYAQSVLTLNVKSALKQFSGYTAGASVLGWNAISKGTFGKITKAEREIINKYTPLLWMREQGYSMRELGDYMTGQDGIEKKMPWAFGWLQRMDIWTAERLWKASRAYVDKNFELEKGSDAYYKEVAKMFNKAIEETQPNYTVMQQADVMRNPNQMVKGLTMFQTQSRQNYNILFDAIGEYKAAVESKDAQWKKNAGKNLKNAVTSQVVSAVVTSVMEFVGGVLLHNWSKWEDEEEEKITLESLLEAMTMDTLSNLFGSGVGMGEVFNFGAALFGDERWYDMGMPSTDIINDVASSIIRFKTIDKGDIRAYVDPTINLAKNVLMPFGIPAGNAEKLVAGFYGWGIDVAKELGADTTWCEYQTLKLHTPASKKSEYGKFLKGIIEEAYACADGERKLMLYKDASEISADMQKMGISGEYIQGIAKDVAKKIYDSKNPSDDVKEQRPWQNVPKGKDFSWGNHFYENVIDSEITRLEEKKVNLEFSDEWFDNAYSKEITYDGVKYKMSAEQSKKYDSAVESKKNEYYAQIIAEDADINTVLNGETDFNKLTKGQKNQLKSWLIYQKDTGKITEAQMWQMKSDFETGKKKAPIISIYTVETTTFDKLSPERQERIKKDATKKYKAANDREGFEKYKTDILSGKVKFEYQKYIYDTYSDLDDDTKKKIIEKIKNKASEYVKNEMKAEIVGK